jgi:hypothetical protein
MSSMRSCLILFAISLICVVPASSQESRDKKALTQKEQKAEHEAPIANINSALPEQPKPGAVEDTGKKTNAHTDNKTDIDGQLAEYTRQLSVYTKELSNYTLWLVIATTILGGIGAYQGWQLKRTVSLARDEFNATHRPRIRVRRVVLEEDPKTHDARVGYMIANVGESPAHITGGMARIVYRERVFGPPNLKIIEGVNIHQETLRPGEQHSYSIDNDEIMQAFQFERPFPFENHTSTLYCYGFIRYTDNLGAIRETAFCRLFERERFIGIGNPDYEYED